MTRALAVLLCILTTILPVSAEPIITVRDKVFGEWHERSVDCSNLWTHPDQEGVVYLTCEFGRQVHGSRTCWNVSEGPIPIDTESAVSYLSDVMRDMLNHYATRHNACGKYAGETALKVGQNPDVVYGAGWRENTFCPLRDAFEACRVATQD